MPDPTAALEILDLALVPGSSPAVYSVGMAASRITIADQQRRAINVIWALLRERRLVAGDCIAIVGGGVAGITAAAYALRQNLRVAVFEKFHEPLALQQGSGRWIHPNIYDWPVAGWNNDQTTLPCMNWRAGVAREVVAQLRGEWLTLLGTGSVEWKPSTEIRGVERDPTGDMLVDRLGTRYGPYAGIIFAAGFGEEATRPEFDGKPYWRDDDLHQRLRSGGTALVSGCGDGGLVDAIRVVLRDFQHKWLERVASLASSDLDFVTSLNQIERNTPKFPDGKELTEATLSIPTPVAVSGHITTMIRPDTKVILNASSDGPFTRSSCLINRFVVAELMKQGAITFRRGRLEAAAIARVDDHFTVTLDRDTLEVDLVVLRHGPEKRPLVPPARSAIRVSD